MINIFDRVCIHKNTLEIQQKQITHPFLEKIGKTLVERFLWSQYFYEKILILGPYNYVIDYMLKKELGDYSERIIYKPYQQMVCDSEFLPFGQDSFDCIFSFFDVQWINDVPGYFKQLQYILKPQGLLTGVFLGGDSFKELKRDFYILESKNTDSFSAPFMPTIHASDAVNLLKRGGFSVPLSDRSIFYYTKSYGETIKELRRIKADGFMNNKSHCNKNVWKKIMSDQRVVEQTLEFVFFTALGSLNGVPSLPKKHQIKAIN